MNLRLPTWKDIKLPALPSLGGKACLGVDIGSYAIKILRISSPRLPLGIKTCVWQKLGEDVGSGRFRGRVESLSLAKAAAAFSIPDERVETHDFSLPKLQAKELETAIEWEVKKTLASPEHVTHDTLTFETTQGYNVQCVVAAKEIVTSRFEEGVGLGLSPEFLEPESSALLATVKFLSGEKSIDRAAILDLGHSSFRLIFIHGDRVSFTRSLYLGLGPIGESLPSEAAGGNFKWEEAFKELGRPVSERSPHPAITFLESQLQESLYTLCEEFRRSEFFAKDQKQLPEVNEIFLCGGGACIPLAVEYLSKQLQEKKVTVLDVFKQVKRLPSDVDPTSGPIWACALGLCLRGIL